MAQAVIFDMDGTLIDSEPLWKNAERQVFTSVGVEVTHALANKTASMTTREVTEFWYKHSPWSGKSLSQVESEVVEQVCELIRTTGEPMKGVTQILEFARSKGLKIGLATNAPHCVIPAVLERLQVGEYFDAISSSEDETQGKPHPAVYLTTARKLNVHPSQCIAFEDSYSGVLSALRAGMKTVAIPAEGSFDDKKYDVCDLKLKQLSDLSDHHWQSIVKHSPASTDYENRL